jgi:predicted trehalose synthase
MRHGRVGGPVEPQLFEPAMVDATTRQAISRTTPDQSNTSVLFGWQLVMKMFRRLESGVNPDIQVGAFLTSRGFSRVSRLAWLDDLSAADGEAASVVMLQRFVPNQGKRMGRQHRRSLVATSIGVKALPEITPGAEADTIGALLVEG